LPVKRQQLLGENYLGGWCAGEDQGEQRYRLFVATNGCASNDDDSRRGNYQPERNKNRVDEGRSRGWDERRENDKGDAKNGD
jgi:hypothetical protein